MHYYTFNIGDYASHTKGLSLLEDLAYRRLLDEYYLAERPLNGCSTTVARLIGMRDQVAEVDFVLRSFFTQTEDGNWLNQRADREIQHFKDKSEKASMAGKASAQRRSSERLTDVEQPLNGRQLTKNQEPITNNHKPNIENTTPRKRADVVCPGSVDQQVWSDFVQHRKAKKAQVTQTVIDGIQREADKAGWQLEAALRECITRNWQSFKADWVADKNLSQTGQMNQRVASGLTRGLIGGDNHVKLLGN